MFGVASHLFLTKVPCNSSDDVGLGVECFEYFLNVRKTSPASHCAEEAMDGDGDEFDF